MPQSCLKFTVLILVGILLTLNSCSNIPDELPEAVRVSFKVTNIIEQARNVGGQLHRLAKTELNLSNTDTAVAYVLEKSILDTIDKSNLDLREFAYSSGTYYRGKGLSGSAELTVPLNKNLQVLVVYFNTQGGDVGYFFTQSFIVTNQHEFKVLIDPNAIHPSKGVFEGGQPSEYYFTSGEFFELEMAKWNNQSFNLIRLYVPSLVDNASISFGTVCNSEDSVILYNSSNQCIGLSLKDSGYLDEITRDIMFFEFETSELLQEQQNYRLNFSNTDFQYNNEIGFTLAWRPFTPRPPTSFAPIDYLADQTEVWVFLESWDNHSIAELHTEIEALELIDPSTITVGGDGCSGSLQLRDHESNACVRLYEMPSSETPQSSTVYLDMFAKQSLPPGKNYALTFSSAIKFYDGTSVFPTDLTVNFQTDQYPVPELSDLFGNWNSTCSFSEKEGHYISSELDFWGSILFATESYYSRSDTNCSSSIILRKEKRYSFVEGKEFITSRQFYSFLATSKIQSSKIVLFDENVISQLNSENYCGLSNWKTGIAVDVLGKTCGTYTYPSKDSITYSKFSPSGKDLMFFSYGLDSSRSYPYDWGYIYQIKDNIAWVHQSGTTADEKGVRITTDSEGNVYVLGHTEGALDGQTNTGAFDVVIVKYDSSGVKQWVQQLGTLENEFAFGIATDSEGNVYVTGYTEGALDGHTNAGGFDLIIAKYDSSGVKQWTRQLGTLENDFGEGITLDNKENVYVTGSTKGSFESYTNVYGHDLILTKYNSSGVRQWTKQLDIPGFDVPYKSSIAIDSSDNIYLSGLMIVGDWHHVVVKYSGDGVRQWTQQLHVSDSDEVLDIATDSIGNVYVTGYTEGSLNGQTNAGGQDTFLMQLK